MPIAQRLTQTPCDDGQRKARSKVDVLSSTRWLKHRRRSPAFGTGDARESHPAPSAVHLASSNVSCAVLCASGLGSRVRIRWGQRTLQHVRYSVSF